MVTWHPALSNVNNGGPVVSPWFERSRFPVLRDKPPTQKEITTTVKYSRATANGIIVQDLRLLKTCETTVYMLRLSHVMGRNMDSRRLEKHYLAGDRSKFVVSLAVRIQRK